MQAATGQWASTSGAYNQTRQGGWSSTSKGKGRATTTETPAQAAARERNAALEEITYHEWTCLVSLGFDQRLKGALTRKNIRCIIGEDGRCEFKDFSDHNFNEKDGPAMIQHLKSYHPVWSLRQVRYLRALEAEREKQREHIKAEQQERKERVQADRQKAREARAALPAYAGLEGGDLSDVFYDPSSLIPRPGIKRNLPQFSASRPIQQQQGPSVMARFPQRNTGTNGDPGAQARQNLPVTSNSGSSTQPLPQQQRQRQQEQIQAGNMQTVIQSSAFRPAQQTQRQSAVLATPHRHTEENTHAGPRKLQASLLSSASPSASGSASHKNPTMTHDQFGKVVNDFIGRAKGAEILPELAVALEQEVSTSVRPPPTKAVAPPRSQTAMKKAQAHAMAANIVKAVGSQLVPQALQIVRDVKSSSSTAVNNYGIPKFSAIRSGGVSSTAPAAAPGRFANIY